MMNVDDEEEYVDFYDFSKAYENHPLLIRDKKPKQLQNVKEKKKKMRKVGKNAMKKILIQMKMVKLMKIKLRSK